MTQQKNVFPLAYHKNGLPVTPIKVNANKTGNMIDATLQYVPWPSLQPDIISFWRKHFDGDLLPATMKHTQVFMLSA